MRKSWSFVPLLIWWCTVEQALQYFFENNHEFYMFYPDTYGEKAKPLPPVKIKPTGSAAKGKID